MWNVSVWYEISDNTPKNYASPIRWEKLKLTKPANGFNKKKHAQTKQFQSWTK